MKTLRAYIVTRVLLTIPMLFVLITFVFFVVRIMPGDPVEAMLRPGVPQEYKDQIKHNLGLDRPLFLNFRGSTARVEPDTLFLQTELGLEGGKAFLIEGGSVLDIGNRKQKEGDWLQVAIPGDFTLWVSPDQLAWMRDINTEMTVLEEQVIPDTETWTHFAAPDGPDGNEVGAIWGEASGLLWFGTDQGVTRYSATGWDTFEDPLYRLFDWPRRSSVENGLWYADLVRDRRRVYYAVDDERRDVIGRISLRQIRRRESARLGIGFVSAFAASRLQASGHLCTVPIAGFSLTRDLFVAYEEGQLSTRLRQEFLTFARKWARSWAGSGLQKRKVT